MFQFNIEPAAATLLPAAIQAVSEAGAMMRLDILDFRHRPVANQGNRLAQRDDVVDRPGEGIDAAREQRHLVVLLESIEEFVEVGIARLNRRFGLAKPECIAVVGEEAEGFDQQFLHLFPIPDLGMAHRDREGQTAAPILPVIHEHLSPALDALIDAVDVCRDLQKIDQKVGDVPDHRAADGVDPQIDVLAGVAHVHRESALFGCLPHAAFNQAPFHFDPFLFLSSILIFSTA